MPVLVNISMGAAALSALFVQVLALGNQTDFNNFCSVGLVLEVHDRSQQVQVKRWEIVIRYKGKKIKLRVVKHWKEVLEGEAVASPSLEMPKS